MTQREAPFKTTVEDLDNELRARGALSPGQEQFKFSDKEGTYQRHAIMEQVNALYNSPPSPPRNPNLKNLSIKELKDKLKLETKNINNDRGIWGRDTRMDFYEIQEAVKNNADPLTAICVKNNAQCVTAICMDDDLIPNKNGSFTLQTKNYKKAFNLCLCEPFWNQPVAVGRLCTGFLVKEDLVATAGHCAKESNVTKLRFFFDYKMTNSSTAVTEIPDQNIYKGVEIVGREENLETGSDWALVKLDRKVVGQEISKLSEDEIVTDRPVYIIGYPVGLPLKYSPGATVSNIHEAYFSADLNVYCGSSGSPVFDSWSHQVVGIVVRGDDSDFRLVEDCWMSVIYPLPDKPSPKPQCTRASKFITYYRKTS